MDRLLRLLGRFVQFSYACWDRIVLRGYYLGGRVKSGQYVQMVILQSSFRLAARQ